MREEQYKIRSKSSATTFEFISEGPKGRIRKRVEYERINDDNLYNLAFGDVNLEKNTINDKIVSNNADTKKVLASVAATLLIFMKKHPFAIIYAKGGNSARARLYQMAVSNNLDAISERFDILGVIDEDDIEVFQKNKNYIAFYISNK